MGIIPSSFIKTDDSKSQSYDLKVKVVLLGDASVGTSIMVRCFWDQQAQYETYVSYEIDAAGIDVNVNMKMLDFDGMKVRTELSDKGGHRLVEISNNAEKVYKAASAVLICYSYRNRKSFQEAKTWLRHAHDYAIKKWKRLKEGERELLSKDEKTSWWPIRTFLVATDYVGNEIEGGNERDDGRCDQKFLDGGFTRTYLECELRRVNHPAFGLSGVAKMISSYLPVDSARRVGVVTGRALALAYTVGFTEVKLSDSKSVAHLISKLINQSIRSKHPKQYRKSSCDDRKLNPNGISLRQDFLGGFNSKQIDDTLGIDQDWSGKGRKDDKARYTTRRKMRANSLDNMW
eukprot:CAMPEP_0114507544 /NCGR_PEP_ID=MMETSP0109-20121206/12072_1 /TAXON_ID=29199 /ORGANISM="Chlorarachnion reptans, Strain CCCM449" /LENGTH=345 /DNA_ID=CAMNT_0001686315 /DNA_START=577 /DNA_END=1611 /DNA_ORIENTATION=+